jgi:hypothetical protein
MCVHVALERYWAGIRNHLPRLGEEIKCGALSSIHANHLLDHKGLSTDEKTTSLHRYLSRMMQRWPHRFTYTEVYQDLAQFLLRVTKEYRSIRNSSHFCWIFGALQMVKQEVQREDAINPHLRHVRLKMRRQLLKMAFGQRRCVVGITVGITLQPVYELLDEAHIEKAICQIFPSLQIVKNSFFFFQNGSHVRSLYVEIQFADRKPFSSQELLRIKAELPVELKTRVERLSQSLFIYRNDEEVIHHVFVLARELGQNSDRPQMSVSFYRQTRKELIFNVTIARLAKEDEPSLWIKLKQLPQEIALTIDEERVISHEKGRWRKVVNIFSLKFLKESFL